jgi:glycosyltransferase involved in cell wall biosynthesis
MFDRNARYWPNHISDYIFYYLYRIYRKKVLRQSKAVTTVSDFHVSTLSPESSSVSLIYNGYDPDLFFQIEPVKLKKFTMVYTGTLGHSAVSSPNMLLSLIKRLDDEGVITPSSFECTFYSGMPKESDILDKICAMNIRGYFKFKEWVSSDEIPKILQNASILLLLCNKSDNNGPKGIMYTKFFEYLAVNRPILCAPSDESTIESIIKNTDAGCSAKSEEEAYSFVKKQYQLWVKNGITIGHAKMSIIESFSRRTQAKDFINIFERFKK